VHHGSVGTTHDVLRAQRPSLVIPHMADQFYWGHALHDRGLGPLPVRFDQIDAGMIAARMSALRDAKYRERAVTLGAAIALEDGVAVAAERLESMT
jgi:UDP:flavonoid glycosyltransferase YjiC (YdhE family)